MMRFTPVRDPDTGRIDMIENQPVEWGIYGKSAVVAATLGVERYDHFYPLDFLGKLDGTLDLHDATLVEIASLMAPHVLEDGLGILTRSWIDTAAMVRQGLLKTGTIAFSIYIDGERTHITLNVTNSDTVLCLFDEEGILETAPIVYWSENGSFSTAQVEDEQVDGVMIDMQMQMRRSDDTRMAVAAKRLADQQPEGVVSMMAFKALRTIRAVQG